MKPSSSLCFAAILVLLSLAATGCMTSRAAAPGEFDAQYQPLENAWPRAEVQPIKIGEHTLPACYRIIYEPSNLVSMVSLSRAPQALQSGGETLEVLLSADVSKALAADLRNVADRLEDWGDSIEFYPTLLGRQKWAKDTAAVLAVLYRFARGSEAIDPREALRGKTAESASAAVAPVVRSLVLMVMQDQDGRPPPLDQLVKFPDRRSLAVEAVLGASFRLARLDLPPGAIDEVEEILLNGPPTALGVESRLVQKLLELRARAVEAEEPPIGPRTRTALKVVPALLGLVAQMSDQWSKFYLTSITIGRIDGRTAVSLVADVRPGEVVRLDHIFPAAPAVTIEGRTRINIWTASAEGRDVTRVQFADERGGRVALRFENPLYAPLKLLAFPIEDYRLREIRVTTVNPRRHRTEQTFDLLLEATRPSPDQRRLLRVHSVRQLEVRTHGETVERTVVTDSKLEYFVPGGLTDYVIPGRIWYYASSSRVELPKPNWKKEALP